MKIIKSLVLVLSILSTMVNAQPYPSKNIHIMTPFVAGTTGDIIPRIVINKLSENLNRSITIEHNFFGATEKVLNAKPDGYTLIVLNDGLLNLQPILQPERISYPVENYSPISLLSTVGFVIVTHPSVPVNSVNEFITLAKKQKDPLNYATVVFGLPVLTMEHLKFVGNFKLVQISFKGTIAPMTEVMSGRIPVMIQGMPLAIGPIQSKKLKALAVTKAKRSQLLPSVPTLAEAGFKGFDDYVYFGIFAPKNTPQDIVNKLNQEIAKALTNQEVLEKFKNLGAETQHSSPDQLVSLVHQKTDLYNQIVKQASIKIQQQN